MQTFLLRSLAAVIGASLLAAVPAATAAQAFPMDRAVAVQEVEFAGGMEFGADLQALLIGTGAGGGTSIEVEGQAIHAFSDYRQYIGAGLVAVESGNGTDEHAQAAHSFRASSAGDSHKVFVSPLPQGSPPSFGFGAPFTLARAADVDEVKAMDMVGVRPAEMVDVRGTVKHDEFGARVWLTIEGSFRMRLWSIDGNVTEGDTRIPVSSGYSDSPVLPANGTELVAREAENRLLFLDVQDGRATFSLPGKNLAWIYASEGNGSVHGSVRGLMESKQTAYDAAGTYSYRLSAVRGTEKVALTLQEPNDMGPAVGRPPDTEVAPAGGAPGQGTDPATDAAPASGSTAALPTPWLASLLPAGLLAVSAILGGRHVMDRRFRRLERHFDDQEYAAAAAAARPLLRSRRLRWDAGTMATVACIRSGQTDDAMALLGRMEGFREADEDALDYLAACVAAARGDQAAAAQVIERLITRNETYTDEVGATPLLRGVDRRDEGPTGAAEGYA